MRASRNLPDPGRITELLRRIAAGRDARMQAALDALSIALDSTAAVERALASESEQHRVNAWSAAERAILNRLAIELEQARRWTLVDAYESDGDQYLVVRCGVIPSEQLRTWSRLSEREREVALGAARGSSNKQLAFELGLAHSTVRVLCHRAMQKLGVATRRALIEKLRGLGVR